MTFTTEMTFEKETEGAVRYAGDQNSMYLLGTLYLRKAGLRAKGEELGGEKGWPQRIRVTVESIDE